MAGRLAGKRILITAAGQGMGRATALMCAAEGADPAQVCAAPPTVKIVEPDPALVEAYRDGYARYRALYPAIRGA